ncbi:ABC transporter substrate-binding protein [Pollutimonas bauzanensis]|jgi:NitT/TauT family transport system substrate-binding protein|uniref:ABC transporter substrate-binding protein n=1 Tax=Pollutimonas bauzanensis TaxID=658167 RepID=UPI00334012D6
MNLKPVFARMMQCILLPIVLGGGAAASAANLTVTHWADGMYGTPFAVALEKGFFKESGIDVTGFITSQGGGTTVRNALASDIPYGEVALSAAIAAIKQGVKLTIVHGGVLSLSDNVWVAKKDSPLNTIMDLKGKKLGYSSPKSVTDMVSTMALTNRGILADVDRKAVGSLSAAYTALREGAVDVIYMTEPVLSRERENLKVVFKSGDEIPRLTQTVGIVRTDYLKQHPDTIKAIIEGRRKGVEYLLKNPEESGDILAKHYKMDPKIAKLAINDILSSKGEYWSTGKLDYEGMNAMLKGLQLVKAVEPGPFDWSAIVDESLLPADQRSK